MENKKKSSDYITSWIAIISFIVVLTYLIYDYNYNYKKVCQSHSNMIIHKAHEVESVNNFGATRNNYYFYLDNFRIRIVNLSTYTYYKEGDTYDYSECWREPIK